MNEQIKQLADRLWRVHPADIDALGLKSRTEFYEHELKKFAELIVRECMTLCEDVTERNDPAIACYYEIKKHFGIGMSTEDKKTLIKELLGVNK